MKTIIIYYSYSSNNELLAKYIQNKLNCDIYKIIELKKRTILDLIVDSFFERKIKIQQTDIDLELYDHIIFISPIWTGKIAAPLRSFISLEKHHFKQYDFITICGQGHNKKFPHELTKLIGVQPSNILELTTDELLIPDKKGKFWNSTAYRLQEKDLQVFEKRIDKFFQIVEA